MPKLALGDPGDRKRQKTPYGRCPKWTLRKRIGGNTEWTVFMAKAIMNRADYVSREDLYLLHDIMERSGRKSI